jgi:hypothetical protein
MSKVIAYHFIDSSIDQGETSQDGPVNISKFSTQFYQELLNSSQFKRSLANDGLLASHALEMSIRKCQFTFDKAKIGIYSAALNGPLLYAEYDKTKPDNGFYDLPKFKKHWPPKQHFRQNGPLRATHYSLITKSQGPLITMVDPINGFIDALNWAEVDLFDETTECAIIISSFSFEDPQLFDWYKVRAKSLKECAVCLILVKDKNHPLVQMPHIENQTSLDFGICTPFFQEDFALKYGISL